MLDIEQTDTFAEWEFSLKDARARTKISATVAKMASGLKGDVEPVGEGVSESRIHHGPGYRLYFIERKDVLIVLLCGGDKSTQKKDIEKAKEIAREIRKSWKTNENGDENDKINTL